MSYAVKYVLSFFSDRKNDYKIEIHQESYSGAVFVKSLGVPPILSIEDGDGAIKGTSLSFSIQSDLEGELKELYTEDNKQFKVLLYRNRELYWQGYLLPELYSENYIDAPYDVAVTATDQLATLKNIVYDQADADRTLSDIISFILQKTQINLAVKQHLSINISDGKTLLDGAYINSATFFGQSCYDVLNAILQSCNACIQQYNGEWVISSLTDKSAEYIIAGVEEVIQHRVIGQLGEQEVYPDGSLEMVCNPALRGVNLEYAHVLKNSFLKNADCTSRDGWMWSMIEGDDTRFPGIIDNLGEVYQCNFWALPQYDLSSTGLQIWQDVEIVADGSRTCELSVNYKMGVRTEHLLLAIIHEGNDGIRRRLTSSGWIEGSNAAEIQNYIVITGSVSNYWLNYWDLIDSSTFETAKVSFNLPAVAGTLRIGFINAAKPGTTPYLGQAPIYLTRVYLNYLGVNGKAANAIVAPSATGAQQDIILSYGDAAQLANDKLAVVNTLRDVTGNVLTDYKLKSLSVDKTFSSYFLLMLQEYSRYFGKKKMQLQGSLMGGDALALMYIDSYSGAILRLRSAQYDLFNEIVNVLLEEVTDDFVEYDTQVIATDNKIASTTTSSSVPTVSGGNTEGSSGEVTIMLGNVAYSSVNGVVVLPAYPDVGLNEEELTEFLTANKYATQSWVKGITDDLETDFEKLEDAVDGIAGYFTNSSANNALKLGGQLPAYYATKSALDTTNGNVVSLTQKMGTAESGISTNKTNIASLTTDLSNLTSRVSTAEGTIKDHTDAIALNANNITSNANNIAFNAKSITAIQDSYVDKSSAQDISGVKTFKNGLKIGEAELVWDSTNKALKIVGSAYVTKDLSFGGYQSPGGGGTSGGGIVTIKVNGQEYTSQNGVVTLPNYPSLAGYATENYVTSRGYITGITSAMVTSALGYTPYNSSNPSGYITASALNGYATQSWVDASYLGLGGGTITNDLTVNGYLSSRKNYIRLSSYYLIAGTNWRVTDASWQNEYTLYHTGNFNPANYLPLSGGTINGTLEINHNGTYPLLVNGADSYSVLQFTARSNRKAEVGWLNDDRGDFAFLLNVNSLGALSVNAHGAYFSPNASDFAKYPILHSNNYESYTYSQSTIDSKLAGYLPLTGGVISAASIEPLMLNNTIADSHCYMHFQVAGVTKAYVGWSVPAGAFLQEGSDWLSVKGGVVSFNANTLIHTGNYANTTDTRYLKLSGGTLTGGLTISSGNFIVSTTAGDTVVNQLYPTVDNTYVLGLGTRRWSSLYTVLINGYTPIHSGNIGSQVVEGINTHTSSAINAGGDIAKLNSYYEAGIFKISRFNGLDGLGTVNSDGLIVNWPLDHAYGQQWYIDDESHIIQTRYMYNGSWSSFRTIAFTDSNVASATKLQTARTIWGQSFDGSGDVSGALYDTSGQEFIYSSGNLVRLGTGTAAKGCNTYIDGNNIYLRYGTTYKDGIALASSGNVLIGATSDNGSKFQVNGTAPSYFYNSSTRYSLVVDSGLASKIIAFGGWDNSEKAQVGYTDGTGFNIFNYQSYRDNNYGEKITGVGITNTGIFYVANSGNPGPNTATLKVETSLVTVIGNLTVTGDITFGSDARYKNKITDVEIDLATIANAPLFIYKWNDREDNREHLGTTAQYWFDTAFKNAVIPTNDEKLWTMSYSEIAIGNTIILAREQIKVKSRVEVLEEKVKQLEGELEKYRRVA